MAADKIPGGQPPALESAISARRRGRTGLAISWEHIPWWGVIILLVGVVVGFSVLTSTQYLDAIYFIFDLPWNRDAVGKTKIEADGTWSLTIKPPLEPGTYTFFAEYVDKTNQSLGRSEAYRIEVPAGVEAAEAEPLTAPSETPVRVQTSTPTLSGVAPAGNTVVLYDDFSGNIGRIAKRIWRANGVFLTIRVTLISFAAALILGLIFGLMRVSSGSPDLSIHAGRRLLIGVVLAALVLAFVPAWRTLNAALLTLFITEAIMFLLPAMPYTFST
ncbi:MAG: hypothetical protein D6796_05690, partial [Caldilineae bacterium]